MRAENARLREQLRTRLDTLSPELRAAFLAEHQQLREAATAAGEALPQLGSDGGAVESAISEVSEGSASALIIRLFGSGCDATVLSAVDAADGRPLCRRQRRRRRRQW